MLEFTQCKERKENRKREEIKRLTQERDIILEEHTAVINQCDLYMNNGERPPYELIDKLFDSTMALIKNMDELDRARGRKSTFDMIVEGAIKMMEESELHVVK